MSKTVADKVDRFLTIHLVLLTLSAVVFWALHYFSPVGDLISRISWQASDPPWVASGSVQPFIGVHYFGDLLTARGFGLVWNPYDDLLALPAQHLPTGQLFMILLTVIPIDFLLILYLLFSVSLLFFAIRTLTNSFSRVSFWKYSQLFVLFSVLGIPMIFDFDRGGLQTIALAGAVFFFGYGLRGKWGVAILWLLFAGSIKPYLLIFSLAFLSKRNLGIHLFLGLAFCSINALIMQAFSGNFLEGFRSMWEANARYTSEFAIPFIANSGSLVGAAHRFSEFSFGLEVSNELLLGLLWLVPIISFLLVVLGLGVWYRTHLPIWIRLMGALSIISVAQPGSQSYNWGWVGVVVIVFLIHLMNGVLPDKSDRIIWFMQILVGLALGPTWIYLDSPSGDGDLRANSPYMILSPIIVFALIYWLVRPYPKVKIG